MRDRSSLYRTNPAGRCVALTLLFLSIAPFAGAQVLPLASYTPGDSDNPLPSAEVQSTFQDSLGYVWMAIYSSGLVRYNGHAYDLYTTDDGLQNPGVFDMVTDQRGRMWVTSDVGLSVSTRPLQDYGANARIAFSSALGTTPLIDVSLRQNALVVDQEGRVWVGTNSLGIVRYTYTSRDEIVADTIRTGSDGTGSIAVRSLAVGSNGTVWAGLSGGSLLVFDKGSDAYRTVYHETAAADQSLNVLHESSAGVLWGGTNEGALMQLDESGRRPVVRFVIPDLGGSIFGMTSSPSGTLWIASEGAGLIEVDPEGENPPLTYTRTNGLLSENVQHVMFDREGNLWISQSGGVSKLRFDHASIQHITANSYAGEKPQLPSATVPAIYVPETPDPCRFWAATQDGGVSCVRENEASIFIQEAEGLRSNRTSALTVDEQGTLWIGTFSGINGIAFAPGAALPPAAQSSTFSFNGRTARVASYRGTSIHSINKKPLARDAARTGFVEGLWFPGFKSIYLLVENRWYVFRASSGLPSSSYNAVELDDQGYLWVATIDQGIYRSKAPMSLDAIRRMERVDSPYSLADRPGTFGQEIVSAEFEPLWTMASGAPTNFIQMLRWKDGTMWVGTTEGVFAIEGYGSGAVHRLTVADGLRSNNVNSMDFSPATGSLWVGTNRGLAEIDPASKRVLRVVTQQDGLSNEEAWFFGSVVVDREGAVYYGTARGVSVYDARKEKSNTVPPKLQIYSATFSENGRGGNEFQVEYAGLSFANEKQVRYRTRLLGYDADWSPVTQEVKIRYTNLPAYINEKTYTFEVQASNNDGVWTEAPVSYSLAVQPALWFRWWALLVYASLIGAIIFTVDRVQRVRLIKKERARAEIEKARELESINKELQDTLDHLTQTRDQLIHAEKMASMGQLTSGIAHEIKNPLNFVNNFANINKEIAEDFVSMLNTDADKKLKDVASIVRELLDDLKLNSEKILMYGERADHIVESMMLHARTPSNTKSKTDFNTFVEQYIGIAYRSMQVVEPGFTCLIEQYYDDEIGTMMLAGQDFGHLLLNLYQNAFQAMHDKKKRAEGYTALFTITTKKRSDTVELRVQDNGVGIADEHLEKIFEPFYTTRPSGTGIGLGLSIGYDIVVNGHSGTLTVESEDGVGTTMVVTLPA